MKVERIDSVVALERIRDAYERVYASDPYRTVFVSWSWLYAFALSMRRRWTLFAVREGGEYLGFLFTVSQGVRIGRVWFYRELGLGAHPTADYTSLLIAGKEDAVIEALGAYIRSLRWDVIRARSVRDPRIGRLLAALGEAGVVRREAPTACHVVPLPQSWEAFVSEKSSKPARRYAIRRLNFWRGATFSIANDETIEPDIDALLALHHRRWKSNAGKARSTYGRLFKEAYRLGCCRVGTLRDEHGQVLAAQAAFIDPERRSWGVYMLAYDHAFSKRSPGIGMLMRGIEHAISEGFTEYDFLRGDEVYKVRFGSEIRWIENVSIACPSWRARLTEHLWSALLVAKRTVRHAIVGGIRASL